MNTFISLDDITNKSVLNDFSSCEKNIFDIVICVGPSDLKKIEKQLIYTKKNIIGYRNIYIISCDDNLELDGCINVSEKIFPFSLKTVSEYHGKLDRNGWYLQQLLKLYSGFYIPNILDKYLVIDADTFFFKPTIFYENGKCLYNYGTEFHLPYFIHMQKLHPYLIKKYITKSGICHHMMFETKYIKELFDIVEKYHNDIFYNIFLKNVVDYTTSGASEYELYFNYVMSNHSNEVIIRKLNWTNSNDLNSTDLDLLNTYDYISFHWHSRINISGI